MKKVISVPAILLLLGTLLVGLTAKAQPHFTAKVSGKGSPVIFVHGLYCTGSVWDETIKRYASGNECHVLTLAGFGGVEPNLHDNFLESVKADIINYAREKKLNKPVIVGHSMGGFLALWAAASEPALFKSVVAVDGLPYFPVLQMPGITPESATEMATNMKKGMEDLSPDQTRANQKMYLPSMIADEKNIAIVTEMAAASHAPTIAQVMYEMFTTDLRAEVAKIDVPVLLLGSWIAYKNYGVTHDSALAGYKAQVQSVAKAEVVLSDTAKHFIFYDDPEWFYAQVDRFIR
ncbi:MAG: alpha/beta hydrolase [Bacteroidia bacterium]|nr:alpha/beta hydrolase [Bacteroidia bacterium]